MPAVVVFSVYDPGHSGGADIAPASSNLPVRACCVSRFQVLCRGTPHEKVEAIFELFDKKEGGGITGHDAATYLISVFRVMYEVQPGLEAQVGMLHSRLE